MASGRGIYRPAVRHHPASFARCPETDKGRCFRSPFPKLRRRRFHPSGVRPGGQEAGQRFSVRVFPVLEGISEDPATGSGNGCLAAYLVKNTYDGSPSVEAKVGQGYQIGRPSTLYLKAERSDDKIVVNVGGKVREVAAGYWKV